MSHDPVNNAVAYTLRDGTANDPPDNFTPPSDKIINGNQLSIPDQHCAEVGAAKSALRRAGFDPQVASGPVTSDCPAGSVAGTQPSGKAPKGAVVTINISSGNGQPDQQTGAAQPPPTKPGRGPGPGPGRAPADCILCPRQPT
jgi:beta-lactam-binding protein with PASTA domain